MVGQTARVAFWRRTFHPVIKNSGIATTPQDCTQSLSFPFLIERLERARCATARETGVSEVNGRAENGEEGREKKGTNLFFRPFSSFHTPFNSHSQEWSISNFSCSLTRNITSHRMENWAFHSLLRSKLIIIPILTSSLAYFLFKRLGEYTFWTWKWKG